VTGAGGDETDEILVAGAAAPLPASVQQAADRADDVEIGPLGVAANQIGLADTASLTMRSSARAWSRPRPQSRTFAPSS
jgi:hypothetical protein